MRRYTHIYRDINTYICIYLYRYKYKYIYIHRYRCIYLYMQILNPSGSVSILSCPPSCKAELGTQLLSIIHLERSGGGPTPKGCFFKLGVLFVGVLLIRAHGVHSGAPDFGNSHVEWTP